MAKNNRSGFLFMFIIFLLLGVIIYTYRDKFYVLLNTGISSGKKIINQKLEKKNSDKIATEKIDLLNKKNSDKNQKKDVKEKIFENIDDIKTNINNIKEKVTNKDLEKKQDENNNLTDIKEKTEKVVKKDIKESNKNIENNNVKFHNKNRKIYFSKLSNDEKLILVSVDRNISYIDTPLTETIKTLLNGPNNNEKTRSVITNIPDNTKLISVWIKNNTAYINFSNDFEFNSFGKDSTITQIKQVVYTATEFSNVKYVQILIDGKIKKYLGGEGVLIEKPFSRSDFS